MRYDFIMGLRRAIGEETQMFFEIDGRSVKAKFDSVVFSGKLVVGHDYPDYKEVLKNFSKTITVDKDALISVLAPFMDILDPEDNNRLTLEIKNKKFQVYNDEASFECDFDVNYGGEFIIDMNGRFLFETVDSIVDDKILMKFTDEKNVLIFDSGNFEDQGSLITPIRRR
jgi:DNA polymerase III sliding clamp (beta) subunit (PCNA family)